MVHKVTAAREPRMLPPAPATLLALARQTPRGARGHAEDAHYDDDDNCQVLTPHLLTRREAFQRQPVANLSPRTRRWRCAAFPSRAVASSF